VRYFVKRAITRIAASSARAVMTPSVMLVSLPRRRTASCPRGRDCHPGGPSRAAFFKEMRAELSPPTPLIQADFERARCVRGFTNVCSLLRLYTGWITNDLGAPIQMQYETWTINEVRDGETVAVTTGATQDEALRAIRVAMYGEGDLFSAPTEVHELPLAA
jgi:hypothetical protein